jgi:CheY-like chemotaxis protein
LWKEGETVMELNKKEISILVVDDEPEIRALITDFLEDEGYQVLNAESGVEALEKVLPANKVDLILSDINMPQMRGFDLLKIVRERYPAIKRVLITAYNVEDYIDLAREHDIGNIFVKTVPFNFGELRVILQNLLKEDIFGVERYFEKPMGEHEVLLRRGDNLDNEAENIITHLPPIETNKKLTLVLVELLANAIFYGIRHEKPDQKETWNYDFVLDDMEAIVVKSMWDAEKFAISICDKGGKLKKNDVLYWLHRQIGVDDTGMPLGLYDVHGRGLFIARKYIDRLIINIKQNVKTEIIIVNFFGEIYQGFKPLYINEV